MEDGISKTFEQRQIIGQIIKGKQIDAKMNLALICGIYYRFTLLDEQVVDPNSNYKVIQAVGNIVTLKKQENEE